MVVKLNERMSRITKENEKLNCAGGANLRGHAGIMTSEYYHMVFFVIFSLAFERFSYMLQTAQ